MIEEAKIKVQRENTTCVSTRAARLASQTDEARKNGDK